MAKLYFTDVKKEMDRLDNFVKNEIGHLRNTHFHSQEEIAEMNNLITYTENTYKDYTLLLDGILIIHEHSLRIDVINEVKYLKAKELSDSIEKTISELYNNQDNKKKLFNRKSIISNVHDILTDILYPRPFPNSPKTPILQFLTTGPTTNN